MTDLGGELRTLDDPATLSSARSDPLGFLAHSAHCLAIDEVQRAPELILPLKLIVDRDPRPGRFLLTGSSDLLRVPGVGDSLAGRAVTVRVRPFSQGELVSVRESFLTRCLQGEHFAGLRSELTRGDYAELATVGGYPAAALAPSRRVRERFFSDYATRLVMRSADEISTLNEPRLLPRLLRLIAARNTQELNQSDLARELGVVPSTLARYVDLLDTMQLVDLIPAWSRNLSERAVRRPKMVISDTGLGADLIGLDAAGAGPLGDPKLAGPLLESFVANELLRQMTWSDERIDLFHVRDRAGLEIDLLLELRDGRAIAIEVKASASVSASDGKWITIAAQRMGNRFIHGYLLYTGSSSLSLGPHLTALPIAALWQS